MKKIFALLLCFALCLTLAACGGGSNSSETETLPAFTGDAADTTRESDDPASTTSGGSGFVQTTKGFGDDTQPSDLAPSSISDETTLPPGAPSASVTTMREYFEPMEYSIYIDIFYNKNGAEYVGPTMKEGVFGVIRDEYSKKLRYYVWGYADQTRCCDFQWEFVPSDPDNLPPAGSYVNLTGELVQDDAALDGYWIVNSDLTVIEKYDAPEKFDFDLTTVSPTLARVQLFYLVNYGDTFDGKTVRVFGRAFDASTLQHPYYDNAWYLEFVCDQKPAVGQYLLLSGTMKSENDKGHLEVSGYQPE